MDLLLQLQSDVCDKLNSEPALANVWIGTFRSMATSQEVEKRVPHLMGREVAGTTYAGLGILIMMPRDQGLFPNVSPPMSDDHLAIWIVENPEINWNPGGNGCEMDCEMAARIVRRILHQWGVEGLTMLYQEDAAIVPLAGIEKLYPGCCGYQVALKGRVPDSQVAKALMPAITESGLTVTLTATDGAAIYYTTDGSFPGPGSTAAAKPANPSIQQPAGTALLYSGPFTVASGTTVRWAGYLGSGYGSDVGQAVIT